MYYETATSFIKLTKYELGCVIPFLLCDSEKDHCASKTHLKINVDCLERNLGRKKINKRADWYLPNLSCLCMQCLIQRTPIINVEENRNNNSVIKYMSVNVWS